MYLHTKKKHIHTKHTHTHTHTLQKRSYGKNKTFHKIATILLQPSKHVIMEKYVSEKKYLQHTMTMLKSKSKAIANDAFNIFKLFVCNPNKTLSLNYFFYFFHFIFLVAKKQRKHTHGHKCTKKTSICYLHS